MPLLGLCAAAPLGVCVGARHTELCETGHGTFVVLVVFELD